MILDGVQWEFELRYGRKKLSFWGSNAFPPGWNIIIDTVESLFDRKLEDYGVSQARNDDESNSRNPFAKADGSPDDNKEPEFLEWYTQDAKFNLAAMSEEERIKVIEAGKYLNRKMNS